MILAATLGHSLARAGLLVDALLAAAALCVSGRARRLAVTGALVLTPVLLAAALWKSSQVLHLRHHPLRAAVAVVVVVALVGALAALFRRRTSLFAVCAVLALPFRFTLLAGGTGGVLLLLYVVIGAGALGLAIWGDEPDAEPVARLLPRVIAAFVVLYAIGALYTPDLGRATRELCFFYVPFALLFVLLTGVRWDRRLLMRCFQAVVSLALIFVAVAAVEYATRRLLFHTALNSNQRFFRVNSLFYDPNIYGRFLALTMVLIAAATMWESSRRRILTAAAVLALLWLGLLGSVSQSSLLALLAGLAVIAAARFSARASALVTTLVIVAAVVIAILASGRLHLNLSDTASANDATSGRASLVKEGIDLFADRPFAGFGSGSFSCEYIRHMAPARAEACGAAAAPGVTSDSHTTPITIAAEQGVIGLLAYVALLGAAVLTLTRGGIRGSPLRVAIVAAFAALVVHTWAYADFLEDPTAWALLAVGAVLARE